MLIPFKNYLFVLVLIQVPYARPVAAEVHMNLTMDGTPFISPSAGPVSGDLSNGMQDIWLFSVSETDTTTLYSAEVTGLEDTGGAVAFIGLERNENREVTRRNDIATRGILPYAGSDGGGAQIGPRLLSAGEYVLGVAPLVAGNGAYKLRFAAEVAAPLPTDATALSYGLWTGPAKSREHCFALPPSRVDLSVFAASGDDITVWLRDGAGKQNLRGNPFPVWRVGNLEGSSHHLCITGQDASSWTVRLGASQAERPDAESEPNDARQTAVPLRLGTTIAGTLDARGAGVDKDAFLIAAHRSTGRLVLATPDGDRLSYTLTDADGTQVKSGTGYGSITIAPFIPKSDLVLTVTADAELVYELAYQPQVTAERGTDVEPNETADTATDWPYERPARGELQHNDTDVFAFDLAADPAVRAQLWRLQADGDDVRRLEVYDASGEVVIRRRNDAGGLLRVSNLYLIPGKYTVSVQGDGAYTLRLLPQGPRRDEVEFEPNDDGEALAVGQTIRGQLDRSDRDRFRFTVRSPEWLTLHVDPPLGETVSIYLYSAGGEVFRQSRTGGHSDLTYTRAFWAGDYEVEIANVDGLSGLDDYTIALLPATAPFGPVQDREPNDYAHSAERWPDNERLTGQVGVVKQDVDTYLLDRVDAGDDLRFCAVPDTITISVEGPDGAVLRRSVDKTGAAPCEYYPELVKGNHVVFVAQNSKGSRTGRPTDYDFLPSGAAVGTRELALPRSHVAVKLASDIPTPASFLVGFSQRFHVRLDAEGLDPSGRVALKFAASEPGWSVANVAVVSQDGHKTTLDAEVTVPPDLSERDIRLHLRLVSGLTQGDVSFIVTPRSNVPSLSAERSFPVPDKMLGGLNMASRHLGGKITALDGSDLSGADPKGARQTGTLIDGLATASNEFWFEDAGDGARFNVALGGDVVVPLAGLLLTPRAAPGASKTLRDFSVEASVDGVTFTEVLRATLGAEPVEQAFVFDEIVELRVLRLIPLSNWTQDRDNRIPVLLGEFKAVAAPGWMPAGTSRFNIADPGLGGHVVWAAPSGVIGGTWDSDLLTGPDTTPSLLRNTDRMSVVLGFHNARAAKIEAIDWLLDRDAFPTPDAAPVAEMTISSSMTGPLGPWAEVARWSPPVSPTSGTPVRFDFPTSTVARFLRFDMVTDQTSEDLRLPEHLRVWEATPTAASPSILGEWGEFSEASAYERSTATRPDDIPMPTGGASPGAAVPLAQNSWISSSVERGARVDWWSIMAPDGPVELRISLDTGWAGGARASVFDAMGTPVQLRKARKEEAQDRGLEMPLYLAQLDTPGAYRIRIEEPLRPIVIAWDTSGSTAPYKAAMHRALSDIALEADPERDLIGLLPFGGSMLGEDMLGEPELLVRRLANSTGGGNSSNAENALLTSSVALAEQDGVRGVILITDAATNRDTALWDTLAKVRPRVAALALPSTGAFGANPARERDLMETWGRANGGFYQYVSSQADFTEGFARAVDRMRGPKPYRVQYGFGPVVPRPDGRLRIVASAAAKETDLKDRENLMILLDTSGSMLQRLGNKRRYEIAQDALTSLTAVAEERGIALGLRRFGIQPDACDTELLAPVGDTGMAEMRRIIAKLRPKNNARTPIAQALTAAKEDLAQREGARRIVILTDGKETCNGDPKAVIEALSSEGISSRVDIVGFAIDDATLTATFEDWARLGQGRYFDAQDADALSSALLDIVQTRFHVTLPDGGLIEGVVGGPSVQLPSGQFNLVIDGQEQPIPITIEPDAERVVEIKL